MCVCVSSVFRGDPDSPHTHSGTGIEHVSGERGRERRGGGVAGRVWRPHHSHKVCLLGDVPHPETDGRDDVDNQPQPPRSNPTRRWARRTVVTRLRRSAQRARPPRRQRRPRPRVPSPPRQRRRRRRTRTPTTTRPPRRPPRRQSARRRRPRRRTPPRPRRRRSRRTPRPKRRSRRRPTRTTVSLWATCHSR